MNYYGYIKDSVPKQMLLCRGLKKDKGESTNLRLSPRRGSEQMQPVAPYAAASLGGPIRRSGAAGYVLDGKSSS